MHSSEQILALKWKQPCPGMQTNVTKSAKNRIVVRKNGYDEGKTDKYTVNNTQKSYKQQKVAN